MALPKPFGPRPEAPSLPPRVRAARDRDLGVFQLGSVVRRTEEPHVRYLLLGSVRRSCLSSLFLFCDFDFFRCGFLCESQQAGRSNFPARKHGPVGRPAVPPSS